MKNDRKIKGVVTAIHRDCVDYLGIVSTNPCAASDRVVEAIIERSKELETLYEMQNKT